MNTGAAEDQLKIGGIERKKQARNEEKSHTTDYALMRKLCGIISVRTKEQQQQKVEKHTECAHAVTVIVGSVLCAMVPSVCHPYDDDVHPFFRSSFFASFVLCCSAACI